MKQLELLTIRQYRQQAPAEIPSKVIRAYVRENMRGFARRQAERERIRAERRRKESPRKPKDPPQAQHTMKTIKITYRAIFEQPIGILNPLNVKLAGPCPVEIFKQGAKWKTRELSSPQRRTFEKLGDTPNYIAMQDTVHQNFSRMIQPWQIWGAPPANPSAPSNMPRLLLESEFCDLGDGTAGWYTAEDRTHILHAPTIPPGAHMPPAACGAEVPAKCFVNNRANVEPTCPECAEIWKKEYQNR